MHDVMGGDLTQNMPMERVNAFNDPSFSSDTQRWLKM